MNIYIYIHTHTIRSLLFSRFSNIQPQYIYFSNIFYSLVELFCLLWYFCLHGCFVFSICKCCSLRHIKFSFILLFTISCDRATQSIPGYSWNIQTLISIRKRKQNALSRFYVKRKIKAKKKNYSSEKYIHTHTHKYRHIHTHTHTHTYIYI